MLDASLASRAGLRLHQAVPAAAAGEGRRCWSSSGRFCHHFCAGIRYLLLDLDIGVELRTARITSVIVIVAGLLLTAFFGARLW